MGNFNVHYLKDANFKVVIYEIKGFINHCYQGGMSASGTEQIFTKDKVSYERKAGALRQNKRGVSKKSGAALQLKPLWPNE